MKDEAADQIAEHGRDLVPDEIVHDRERRVQHQPRRKQEHVHDGMLEHHVEEHQDRHPHRDAPCRGPSSRSWRRRRRSKPSSCTACRGGTMSPCRLRRAPRSRAFGLRRCLPMTVPTLSGACVKPNVVTNAIKKAVVSAPAKLPTKTRPQFLRIPLIVTPGRLSSQASGAEDEHARQQIEAQQDQHGKSDRKQQRADERLAGVDVDRDGEPGRQCENRAGHVGADERVSGRHEDFGFASVDHLGDEFRRDEIGHGRALLLSVAVSQSPLSN